ncbi:PQQ-binding-like beta-propeller repeat protein [Nocardioidaceae bacterium]|nr:PQQ-binding-like beta-propeller repeat protein [Nocardioidaceae bacterium]
MSGRVRRPRLLTRALAAACAAALVAPLGAGPAQAAGSTSGGGPGLRPVVLVGNNWAGTIDVLTPGSWRNVARIDAIPDERRRLAEIATDPERLAFFNLIALAIGEGNNQYVDDMYLTPDGRNVVVSRPSFADVVSIDLRTGRLAWRFEVDGQRSDHMAVSPDGTEVAVSASTGNVVHVLDIRTGREKWTFPSGDSPHENVYLADGREILHASIGLVYTPLDREDFDSTKGDRQLQVVNTRTRRIKEMIDVRGALDARGLTRVSNAVRPLTVSPDERFLYFQLSFFHGFFEYDRRTERITRVKRLPDLRPFTLREQYVLDSAHHGIAMNPNGKRICVAGTVSDYATVVNRGNFKRGPLLKAGEKAYWATPSQNGRFCYVSWSGTDTVSKISYRTRRVVETTRVGDHPQRVRNGFMRKALFRRLSR